jgi:DNA-binding MarR family transcriptional regulator
MDKMMVSDVVKTLESKSLIVRQKGLVDKRAFSLRATADALKLLKNATPLVEGVDEAFFGVLTATERKDLISSMLKLNRIED